MTLEERARARASTAALNVFNDFGEDRARAIYRGYLAAFAIAFAALEDGDSVRRFINETLPPPKNSKPRLAYSADDLPAA